MSIKFVKKPTKLEKQVALFGSSPKAVVPAAVVSKLPGMIQAAAKQLASAVTAAEVLEARDMATMTYEAAKMASRMARAKSAHDEVSAKAKRAQADALQIESEASARLADEYDRAQKAGEVGKKGQRTDKRQPSDVVPKAEDVGLTRKEVMDARSLRDAIEANPEVLQEALAEIIDKGGEPTRNALKKAIAPTVNAIRAEKTEEKKAKRVEREIATADKIKALPVKKYGVIVADPEWRFEPYSRDTGMDRAADNHYSTTETKAIAERGVDAIAAKDCVLFLWATAPMLQDAMRVMEAWGFTYKTHAIWFKERTGDGRGSGYWFLGEHELLLVGTRGKVVAPAPGTQFRSVIVAPVGPHSAKPEAALEIIETYFPNIPKIELNRRGAARPGWDAWGAEAEEAA